MTNQEKYSWHLTQHAQMRWIERFPEKGDIVECLDKSKKIGSNLRSRLIASSRSKRHRANLGKNSGFFIRLHGECVFVLDNLRLVTVYRIPGNDQSNKTLAKGDGECEPISWNPIDSVPKDELGRRALTVKKRIKLSGPQIHVAELIPGDVITVFEGIKARQNRVYFVTKKDQKIWLNESVVQSSSQSYNSDFLDC